ncbi:hypothetical protein AGLY_016862 [Aphis glycines]|uniref:Integrase catalytic domain-containing protein n=1 Tax=Aphis glycines TaxID=307491 RepID=A0A6G0SWK5_APHGL|nr:hypothetical protein AGLY_016862 [Aphis glycines]
MIGCGGSDRRGAFSLKQLMRYGDLQNTFFTFAIILSTFDDFPALTIYGAASLKNNKISSCHCCTKFAWAVPLKSKTGKEVTKAMSKILDRSPKLLQLDNGKEFYNTIFDTLMTNIMKACIVKRFNRTLKEKMFREFTARGSHEWISILPKLLNEYNNSKHRTLGMTSTQADLNLSSVTIKQREINNEKIKFKVGDNVRISTQKGVFTKEY